MGISAQEAQRRYDLLGRSDWRAASLWGVALALEETLHTELARAVRREVRMRAGVRSRPGKPMPPWVIPALVEVVRAAQVTRLRTALVRALTEPAVLEFMIALCQQDSLADWFAELDVTQRVILEERVMPLVRSAHSPRKAAGRNELEAFFRGVRAHFHVSGFGEPKPSEMRWLAAARLLEPIAGSVDEARIIWEDRLRRWRPKMDREWSGWREVIGNSIPWQLPH
jgi:hypothetical protein